MRRPDTEEALYEHVAQYLRLKHPDVIFHFDLSGMWTPSHKARNLYGRLNRRAWPDLFIALPTPKDYVGLAYSPCGLFIELKREGTRLKKRDGSWASEHLAEQATVLEELREQGFAAVFAVGLEDVIGTIEAYMWASGAT